MSGTTTPAELRIPQAAADAAAGAYAELRMYIPAAMANAVAAAAPIIVAAELRRFADTLDEWVTDDPDTVLPQPHTVRAVTARLRVRADELDGA